MANPRIYLWIAVALLLWMNLVQWNRDYGDRAAPAATTPVAAQPETGPAAPADASLPELPALPSTQAPAAAPSSEAPTPAAPAETASSRVRVMTDVLDVDISLSGGNLVRADLLAYPHDKQPGSPPVRLLDTREASYNVDRSGLRALNAESEPNHLAKFTTLAQEFRLAPGASELRVPLIWTDGAGITVAKTFVFRRGRYDIELAYQVDNRSEAEWSGASYVQLVRHIVKQKRSMFDVESYAYRGPAVFDGSSYRKLDIEDDDDALYAQGVTDGWVASLQHHFVSAAVPPKGEEYHFTLTREGEHAVLSYRGPLKTVPAGTTGRLSETLFVGPKLQDQLRAVGPKLERTADYGKLTIIAQPLFWVLEKVHAFVRNWGLAIIIVTFLIKLAFYRLTAASGRSMAKMRNVAPRIKAIQERYKDDREQLGRQMMELYKREKINPLAGCLPILIQIPFFLSFYWVLLESVEMRQAPFFGWISDLSTRDPYFILPLLMGAAMFAQFKLQPMPSTDPMQAKVFQFMPVIMSVTMAWFPAGLVLYWLTNTLLSIAQQWRINKLVAAEQQKT